MKLVHNIKFKKLGISCAISLGVGALSALLTMSAMKRYDTMIKPPLSPPAWLFPIVWTILFLLMGISAYLVFTSRNSSREKITASLWIYAAQLVVNFFWPIIFFNLSAYLLASVWIVILLFLIIVMTIAFYQISKPAGLLQIPYVLWVSFATYLTIAVFMLN